MSTPIHTGAALAATVAVGYAACTFVFALAWAFGLGGPFGWLFRRLGKA